MHLVARIALYFSTSGHARGSAGPVERSPGLWRRLARSWRGSVAPERVRAAIEGVAFVHELHAVLVRLGIDDARSLIIDGVTVFRDLAGRPGDLPDLMLALDEHTGVFGPDCRELRMAVDTEEAGLGLAIEAAVSAEHEADAPAARLSLLGQRRDLRPSPGEDAASYRDRIDRFLSNPRHLAGMQLQFDELVSRLEGGLREAFVDARLEVSKQAVEISLPVLPEPSLARSTAGNDAAALLERSSPARNFSLSLEQRIGALMSGPPVFALRLRRIEALEQKLVAALAAAASADAVPLTLVRALEEVNGLIADHNRYYPIERNLPMDPATGGYSEMGSPWRPRPAVTVASLLLRAKLRS